MKEEKIKYSPTTGRALNGPFKDYPKNVIARFREYHLKNPEVYKLFKQYAIEMRDSGRKKYSAEIIINLIRWHQDIATKSSVFKISNDFKPLYARLLAHREPEFETFFQFKQVTSIGAMSKEEKERLALL